MKEEIYDIGGMHCAACSGAVERVTGKLPGVERSSVNLPMNRLTISYDETVCTPDAIISKVEKAGFTAAPHEITEEKAKSMDGNNKKLLYEKTALIVSVCFAGILLFVSMGHMVFPSMHVPDLISMKTHPMNFALLQLLLCIPVLFLGRQFFVSGFRSLLHGYPNMDTLVALSSSASFLYSLVMTFLITDNPHSIHNLYFESAAVVVALVSVGKYLESSNKEKTKDSITKLMKLAPDTAVLVDENGQWEVPTKLLKVGDTMLVKPGARIPLDGIVTTGSGSVNEAMLTGESLPVEKSEGSEVIGGSISVDGALYVRVTRIGADTTLSKIIEFVEDAQGKKAPIAKTADKVAGVFVPIVMVIALVSASIWLLTGAELSFALKIFTCVLVIACPCAMGLATPTSIIVGTGLGASKGILIRNGEMLEITHKVNVAIFDKTGTVTEGKPSVTDIISKNEKELLQVAYALEKLSAHPLSGAICDFAAARGIEASNSITQFESITGRGLSGRDEAGHRILAGNAALMTENDVSQKEYTQQLQCLQGQGKTIVLIARDKTLLGLMAIADTIKSDAEKAVSVLKEMEIKTVLLTGDNRTAAKYIGTAAGVDETVAEVLPTQKAEVVKRYQEKGNVVMMVGDGINDAPALMQADVGCAIGNGSDIAIDSAGIVLMKSNLMDVYHAIRLSRLTIRNIRQNLFWAFCYNTLGIPVAAGVLYPSLHLLLSPMIGGIAMSLSSLFVVTNALRLKGKKL
jgi:Cu+-exporting ATPase